MTAHAPAAFVHASRPRGPLLSLIPAFAVFCCLAAPAMAAGAVPPLVQDIGTSLLLAGALAVVFARLKIPSIAGFLVAGILLGPVGFNIVSDAGNIEAIAQIGFVLLLFVIGLEIDVRSLLASGKNILVAGALQFPLTWLFGVLAAKALLVAGFGGVLAEAPLAPLYVGIAIAGSSSLLVVKLFQEHFQLDTQPGRISLTILILQDIWAIVATIIQPSLASPDLTAIAFSFVGIGLLVAVAALLSRILMSRALAWIAKSPELILLGAVSWCFAMVALGASLDGLVALTGLHLHLSVGAGMAALIAGATIASLPFSTEIVSKVGLVKDFFITLFFVGLGITMPAIDSLEIPLLAIGLGLLAIAARQLVFFPVFSLLGIDQRSAEVSAIRLAQISEFSLVIAFLGVELGHISREFSSVIILAFVFTAILTTPLFERAYDIHKLLRGTLRRLGFREPKETGDGPDHEIQLMVLGIHRDASSFLSELSKSLPEVLPNTVALDFNVAIHSRVRKLGVEVVYGDIANEESLLHAGADRARVIICTIPDDLLRGINNVDLVRMLRRLNPGAVIIANAIEMRSWKDVKEAGADIVYMPRLAVAELLVEALRHAYADHCDLFTAEQHTRFGHPHLRPEILE